MAATVVVTKELNENPRRNRRAHFKSRTGCTTCKIRKKKCDETKPACVRCTSTGRKCDGYTSPPPRCSASTTTSAIFTKTIHPDDATTRADSPFRKMSIDLLIKHREQMMSLCRSPVLVRFESDIERSCFDHFRLQTGPQIASYFDSAIWKTVVIQAAMVHPAVLRATIAVGAVHRRFELGITREAFEYCVIAKQLQAKALSSLRAEQARPGSYTREVSFMASTLHGLFECFQANYADAVGHLTTSLRAVMSGPMRVTYTETRYCKLKPSPTVFTMLFQKLQTRASQLFGTKPNILCRQNNDETLPDVPRVFDSLEQARDFIFTEVDWILHAPSQSWQCKEERLRARRTHVTRMLEWSIAYAETLQHMPDRTRTQKRSCILLKMTRNAAYLMLYLLIFMEGRAELPPLPDPSEIPQLTEFERHEFDNSILDMQETPPISMLNHHLFRITQDNSIFGHSSAFDNEVQSDTSNQFDYDLDRSAKMLWNAVQQREELTTNLARVCILAEAVIDENHIFAYDEHSINLATGIGPPLRPEPVPSSSAKTRHRVRSTIMQNEADEKMWKILGVYGVAEQISSIEEHAVVAAVKDFIPPGKYEPKWVDVTCFLDEGKLVLRYCRMDDEGKGLLWTQQWLAF